MKTLDSAQGNLEQGAQNIQQGLQNLNNQLEGFKTGSLNVKPNVTGSLKQVNDKINGAENNIKQLDATAQSNVENANKAMQDVVALQEQIKGLPEEYQEKLKPFITNATNSTAVVQKNSAGVAGTTGHLKTEVSNLKENVSETVNGLQTELPNPQVLKELAMGVEKLTNGQNGFVTKFQEFGKGLDEAKSGTVKIEEGSQLLDGGISKLAENGPKLINGLNELTAGSNKINGGLNKLSTGSEQLTLGANKLADGSNKVTSGLGQLTNGSGQVTTGLGTLSGGTNQLVDGVNKLADGSGPSDNGLRHIIRRNRPIS